MQKKKIVFQKLLQQFMFVHLRPVEMNDNFHFVFNRMCEKRMCEIVVHKYIHICSGTMDGKRKR